MLSGWSVMKRIGLRLEKSATLLNGTRRQPMTLKRVSAQEAKKLMDSEGYTLVDVRSIPEFTEAHPEGAYNIPFLHKAPHGMVPNQDFAQVVEKVFADKETKLITSCQMGGRSVRAAQELANRGYTNIIDLKGGFGGEKDPDGNIVFEGWKGEGLPVSAGEPAGRAYGALHTENADGVEAAIAEQSPAATPAAPLEPEFNRFAHATKTVQCVKLGKELPALKRTPMGGPLGKRIRRNISADAWNMWVEHSKMIINEYRLNAAEEKAQEVLMKQCEDFFFGEGVAAPPEFVPEGQGPAQGEQGS